MTDCWNTVRHLCIGLHDVQCLLPSSITIPRAILGSLNIGKKICDTHELDLSKLTLLPVMEIIPNDGRSFSPRY